MFTLEEMLSIGHIAEQNLSRIKGKRITGVCTDSRTVASGDVFVAIRGERFDGHEFVNKAIQHGAVCAIVDKKINRRGYNVPMIVVKDTTRALGELARLHRRRFAIPLIGVTGSNGKTTTKEMIHGILRTKYNVLCTKGNLNNHIGVPQTLFRLNRKHEVAIVEMGMNHPGEIQYLCEIAEPTHGIVTNIGKAHLGYFKNVQEVAKAKGELFDWLEQDSDRTGFINLDDALIVNEAKNIKTRKTFSQKNKKADMVVSLIKVDKKACPEIRLSAKLWKKPVTVKMKTAGIHSISNAAASALVGNEFGVQSGEIKKALEKFKPVAGRFEVVETQGVRIINDAYNANPESMKSAIETVAAMECKGRRIFVLGDMFELGKVSAKEHKKLGSGITKRHGDMLLTFGTYTAMINKNSKIKVKFHFQDREKLVTQLFATVRRYDIVLIKGSHGMNMYSIADELQKYLCQQSVGKATR